MDNSTREFQQETGAQTHIPIHKQDRAQLTEVHNCLSSHSFLVVCLFLDTFNKRVHIFIFILSYGTAIQFRKYLVTILAEVKQLFDSAKKNVFLFLTRYTHKSTGQQNNLFFFFFKMASVKLKSALGRMTSL